MTNEELEATIAPRIEELTGLNEAAIEIAKHVLGETLFKTDLYFCAMLNKSLQVTDGFIEMIKRRNLSCSGILLRTNMDNCLRMFALYIAEDLEEIVDCVINGNRISRLKDKDRQFLGDGYLKDKLGKYDRKIIQVYNNASGYVHFSDNGFYQSVSAYGDGVITAQVSHSIPEKANEFVVECVEVYIHYLKLFYQLFSDVIQLKREYDSSY